MIGYLFLAGLAMFSLGAVSGFIVATVLGAGSYEGSDLFPPDADPWLPDPSAIVSTEPPLSMAQRQARRVNGVDMDPRPLRFEPEVIDRGRYRENPILERTVVARGVRYGDYDHEMDDGGFVISRPSNVVRGPR